MALLHSNYELCQALSKATAGGTVAAAPPVTTASVPVEMLAADDMADAASCDDEMDVDQDPAQAVPVNTRSCRPLLAADNSYDWC